MSRGAAEFRALTEALETTAPACRDDWRYTLDESDIDKPDIVAMKGICRRCPLTGLCASFAVVARPEAGMWAGNYYRPRGGRK